MTNHKVPAALFAAPAGAGSAASSDGSRAYTATPLVFARGGIKIDGVLYLPDVKKPPVVIISHGFGGTRRDTARYAEALTSEGIAVYVFDFYGGSENSKSGGSMLDMSVLTEKEDLSAVLDGIKQSPSVDGENVFLMGESQGGFVSAMVARDRVKDIKALILVFPALVIPDDARKLFSSPSEIQDKNRVFGYKTVGRKYYEAVYNMDAYKEIMPFKKDVLIFHGDKDDIVPISYSVRAQKEYDAAELVIVKGAGHGFSGKDHEDTARRAASFIKSHVK